MLDRQRSVTLRAFEIDLAEVEDLRAHFPLVGAALLEVEIRKIDGDLGATVVARHAGKIE